MPLVNDVPNTAAKPAGGSSRAKANKAFAEKKKAQKKAVIAYLDTLPNKPAEIAAILNEWKNGAARSGTVNSLFNQLFGGAPAVGASITLKAVFDKTNSGVKEMAQAMKKWSKNGIIVQFVENPTSFKDSTYVIKSLG